MWKENLYQPFEILLREHDVFPIGEHQHSFFEMVYIVEGSGSLSVSTIGDAKEKYAYTSGCLFLIPPNTPHLFTIDTHCKYIFIRYTENYVEDYIVSRYVKEQIHVQSGFQVMPADGDMEAIDGIMKMIVSEVERRRNLSEYILQYYVNTIIMITARFYSGSVSEPGSVEADKAQYMLQYIQHHIHQPEMLTVKVLADKFAMSPTYVGRFFKRNFDEDLKSYVFKSRLRKVVDMLTNTNLSIKEIAYRLGYVDASYLNRLFMKNFGMTPVQYRKRHSAPL